MREQAQFVIHLDNLSYNLKSIKALAPQKDIILMVKANAYGHGLVQISKFCFQNLGIQCFGVATFNEALSLRNELSDSKLKVYVFSETNLSFEQVSRYEEAEIIPVIWKKSDLPFVLKSKLPLVLKFNTGMNRLGLSEMDITEIADNLKKEKKAIDHLMTHFSSANLTLKKDDQTSRQYELFCKIKDYFTGRGIEIHGSSVSNSAAIEQGIGLAETAVRPGIMAYGPSGMLKSKNWNGKLVSSLECEVLHSFKARKGTPIGYGGWILDTDAKILILPLGYGDGIHYHSTGFEFNLGAEQAKIIGRVNMDMMAVKVSMESKLSAGDKIILWDENHNFSSWYKHLKTIPYELLCSIGPRLPRFYRLQ